MTSYRALLDLLGIPFVGNTARRDGARRPQGAGARRRRGGRGPRARGGGAAPRGASPRWRRPSWSSRSTPTTPWASRWSATRAEYAAALAAALRALRPRCWSRPTSSSAARCAAGSSSGTASWSPAAGGVRRRRGDASRSATTADKIGRDDDGELGLVAKDAEHAWIVDPADPVDRAGAGGRPALPPRRWAAATTASSTSASTRTGSRGSSRPGSTARSPEQSVVAVMAAAAGIGLEDLLAEMVGHHVTTEEQT